MSKIEDLVDKFIVETLHEAGRVTKQSIRLDLTKPSEELKQNLLTLIRDAKPAFNNPDFHLLLTKLPRPDDPRAVVQNAFDKGVVEGMKVYEANLTKLFGGEDEI